MRHPQLVDEPVEVEGVDLSQGPADLATHHRDGPRQPGRAHRAALAGAIAHPTTAYRAPAAEIRDLDAHLAHLLRQAAPQLLAVKGLGPLTCALLLVAIGDNPERMRNESAFAHLCGVAPLSASSGRTTRHRPGSKHHLIVDAGGIPLVDAVPPIRGRRGRPRRRPRELFADRGYDYDVYRRQLRVRSITPRIARRGVAHGSGLGRQRWVVERSFAWLHAFQAAAHPV